MTRPGHIFISHGSDNRAEANELAHFLERRGGRAWIAPRDVRPGMDYSEQLQLAIEECAAFVVLVTADSNKSPYVRVETEMAFSINKPIFPVRISDVKPAPGLALFLKIKHWTDAYGAERDSNLERLVRELQVLGAVAPAAADPERPAAAPVTQAPPPPPPPPAPPADQPGYSSWAAAGPVHAAASATGAAVPASAQPAAYGTWTPGAPSAHGGGPAHAPAAGDPGDFAREEVKRAMIGPNADHYIESWRRMDSTGSKRGFNIGALLGNYLWLAYRKMWIPLGAGIGVILLGELVAGAGTASRVAAWLLILGFCVALGLFGDFLYRWHLRRLFAGGGSADELQARGGTSLIGPAVLAGLAVLAAIIASVAMSVQSSRTAEAPAAAERPKEGSGKSGGSSREEGSDTARGGGEEEG